LKNKSEIPTKIMLATMELIAENGFQGAPTTMIVKRAGVGMGSIYRHFKNKDGLISAIHIMLRDRLNNLVSEFNLQQTSVRNGFIHNFCILCHYLLKHPLEFKFLNQFYNSPFGVAYRQKVRVTDEWGIITEPFEYGIAQGEIKDLPFELLCAIVFGPMEFALRSHDAGLIKLDKGLIDELAEACWSSLRR
jgi:TetR/AcrR family transcriptional regulator, repressor of fatR-cypB operon